MMNRQHRSLVIAAILTVFLLAMLPTPASALPPETPACNNGFRIRACVHPSIVDVDKAAAPGALACGFTSRADYIFEDPLFATPFAGDFEWSWNWNIVDSNENLVDSGSGGGTFEGVPLYPYLGLVIGDTVNVALDFGDTFNMWATAWDNKPLSLEDEATAFFAYVCAAA